MEQKLFHSNLFMLPLYSLDIALSHPHSWSPNHRMRAQDMALPICVGVTNCVMLCMHVEVVWLLD